VLQELFGTDYVSFRRPGEGRGDTNVFEYAESIPGPTTTLIAEAARKHGIFIVPPIFEKRRECSTIQLH
jgi:predicted amidohydrolase